MQRIADHYGKNCEKTYYYSICLSPRNLFSLYVFFFPQDVPRALDSLCFNKLCVDMHVNKKKFERNSSLGVLSHDLYWENKTFKLKRSIAFLLLFPLFGLGLLG